MNNHSTVTHRGISRPFPRKAGKPPLWIRSGPLSAGWMRFVFILAFPHFLHGQSAGRHYVWPTDASCLVTSSFGEYRSNHIHAGLDVKTWGSEGWKVFAVDSGSVVRVEATPYGYGRALVVRLHNGMKVLYAHLSRFSEPIEEIIRMEQRRAGRFAVALEFEPGFLPVARGETVAFTGSTGAGGGPHLHFEVWDRNGDAVNPMSLGFAVTDGIWPTLRALAFTPLDFGSFVEGDFETRIVPLRKTARGRYTMTSKVRAWGDVGIALSAFDMLNGAATRIAPYRTRLFVDEKPVFSETYDRFPQSITRQIRLERDYRLDLEGKGVFDKLYVDAGNTLPFYQPPAFRSGVLSCWDAPGKPRGSTALPADTADAVSGPCPLSPGDHAFRIEVSDYSGNVSIATGTLSMIPLSRTIARTELPKRGWSGGIPGGTLPPRADVHREFIDDCLKFRVVFDGPVADIPRLMVGLNGWSKTQVELLPKSAGEFIGVMPLDENVTGTMTTELRYASETGMEKKVCDTLQVYSITPDYGGTMFSPDGIFRVDFPPQSVYKPVWGTIRMEPVPEKTFGLGRRYWVEPADLSPGNPVNLVFDPGGACGREAKTGIYASKRYGGWSYLDSHWENGQLTAWTRDLMKFSAFADTVAPSLWGISPAPGAVLNGKTPVISMRFSDGLSGVTDEDNYGIRLDGAKLVMEYNPRWGKAFHRMESPLAPGKHAIEAWVRDHAGNLTEDRREFFIR
jgi:hypothetical protein